MPDDWRLLEAIVVAVVVAMLIALLVRARRHVTTEDLESLGEHVDGAIEQERKERREEITNVHKRVDDVVDTLGPMRGHLEQIDSRTGRIEDKLDRLAERQPPKSNG